MLADKQWYKNQAVDSHYLVMLVSKLVSATVAVSPHHGSPWEPPRGSPHSAFWHVCATATTDTEYEYKMYRPTEKNMYMNSKSQNTGSTNLKLPLLAYFLAAEMLNATATCYNRQV